MNSSDSEPSRDEPGRFATTHWSLVVAAGDRQSPEASRALGELCSTYWYPLYAFARRRGQSVEEAQDSTQEFFALLLERDRLSRADPGRGRFRAFLLTSFQNFLLNQWRGARAQRRGGGRVPLSLDFDSGERRYALEPIDRLTPERIYERRWALTLLERTFERLRAQYEEAGKLDWFLALQPSLEGRDDALPYAELTDRLGASEAAIKVAVHRLRKRCGAMLREEIAQTVSDPTEIDAELTQLLAALG